jgi:hypothetical protein
MRRFLAIAFAACTAAACAHDVEPETIRELIAVEQHRPDDPGKTGAQLITDAADRYVEIYRAAKTPDDVAAIDQAFKTYCDRILDRVRRRLDNARERARMPTGKGTRT